MFADNMQKTATRLLNKFGNAIEYVKVTTGGYDVDIGDNVKTTESHMIQGLLMPYASSDLIPGVISIDDVKLSLPVQSFTPSKEDHIIVDGKSWKVMAVVLTTSQDKSILYQIQLRSQ